MTYTASEIANEIFVYLKYKKELWPAMESQFKVRSILYLIDLLWEEEHGEYLINERPVFKEESIFPHYKGIVWPLPFESIEGNKEFQHDVIYHIWSICELVWNTRSYEIMKYINDYKTERRKQTIRR